MKIDLNADGGGFPVLTLDIGQDIDGHGGLSGVPLVRIDVMHAGKRETVWIHTHTRDLDPEGVCRVVLSAVGRTKDRVEALRVKPWCAD